MSNKLLKTRTEKTIEAVGFILWFHLYVGILALFFWISVIWKDGPGMLVILRIELKVLWIIIISGGFFFYTIGMLWLFTAFKLIAARMMIGVIKTYIKVETVKKQLVEQLEKFKDGINVTDKG